MYPLTFGLRVSRPAWPPLDTTVSDPRIRLITAFMQKDTSRLRRATRRLDSLSRVYIAALVPDTGITLVAAQGYLALYDSAAALRMTRRWLDSSLVYTPLTFQSGNTLVQPLIPGAMLLRADLAAGLGQKEEAALWYKRLLDFWVKAQPEFQPLIERVKKSYAAIGGS
jgi:hypothetical protein